MILRDRCSASYHFYFSWQAQYLRHMGWKNRKTHWYEAVGCTQISIFEGSLAECFVFDVVNFNLEEIAQNCFGFFEEVSQTCFVLFTSTSTLDS